MCSWILAVRILTPEGSTEVRTVPAPELHDHIASGGEPKQRSSALLGGIIAAVSTTSTASAYAEDSGSSAPFSTCCVIVAPEAEGRAGTT